MVSTACPARVTLLYVCYRLAYLLHKCVREEKCVRLCVCLLQSLSYLTLVSLQTNACVELRILLRTVKLLLWKSEETRAQCLGWCACR